MMMMRIASWVPRVSTATRLVTIISFHLIHDILDGSQDDDDFGHEGRRSGLNNFNIQHGQKPQFDTMTHNMMSDVES